MLYSGEYDIVCNHLGTERMIHGVAWNNRTGFDLGNGTLAPIEVWIVKDELAGVLRTARNLTYILFYNAGHSATYSQAHQSRAMLYQFFKLNFTSIRNLKMKDRQNKTKSYFRKNDGVIVFSAITIIVIFTGFIWMWMFEKHHLKAPTSCNVIQSKCQRTAREQPMVYSLLEDRCEDL